MKNYQQTPRQRKAKLAKAKTILANQRNQPFQPRTAWSSKRKLGGVAQSLLVDRQLGAQHPGVTWPYRGSWWGNMAGWPRKVRRA